MHPDALVVAVAETVMVICWVEVAGEGWVIVVVLGMVEMEVSGPLAVHFVRNGGERWAVGKRTGGVGGENERCSASRADDSRDSTSKVSVSCLGQDTLNYLGVTVTVLTNAERQSFNAEAGNDGCELAMT